MNASIIEMPQDEARTKLLAYQEEHHSDAAEFNAACEVGYESLAAGKRLLHLSKSFRQAGLDEKDRPRLAIARADRKEVSMRWRRRIAVFNASYKSEEHARNSCPTLIRDVSMEAPNAVETWRRWFALAPAVPADVRPPTGQLRQWFVLWEVEEWFASSRTMTAPRDPFLLEHIGGELYAVLAEWELTPLEQAVLEGSLS